MGHEYSDERLPWRRGPADTAAEGGFGAMERKQFGHDGDQLDGRLAGSAAGIHERRFAADQLDRHSVQPVRRERQPEYHQRGWTGATILSPAVALGIFCIRLHSISERCIFFTVICRTSALSGGGLVL